MLSLFRSDPSKVNRLIAGFPGPLYLRASAIKWWTVIAVGPAFAGLFGYIAILGHLKRSGDAAGLAFVGVVIGLLLVVMGRKGLRGSLRLDHSGFQISAQKQYAWFEVSDFGTYAYKGNRRVTFALPKEMEPRLVGGAYWPGMDPPPPQSEPSTPEMDPFFVVRNHRIPDTYGLSAYDLARLMNGWRKLAIEK
jgi:hypothetical protein